MTGGSGSTERHYRRLLDKLKARSNRIFVKAQMQNRTQEQRLKKVVHVMEKERDLCIRKSHEGIWRVSSKECPMPRLAKLENMPSYLARPRATTLPTPAELATLLPKKRVRQQPYTSRAESVAISKAPPKEYTRISRRKLSMMTSDQVQIYHYRKVLEDFERKSEVLEEADEKEENADTTNVPEDKNETLVEGGMMADGQWAIPVTKTKSLISEASKALAHEDSTAAAEESVRMVMKKLGMRPQSSPLSYTRKTRPKKRPQTSPGTCATIAEQQLDSKSKVLRTNYLDMYKVQLKNHVRRMKSKGEIPAPSTRIDTASPSHLDDRPKSSLERSALSRASTPIKAASQAPSKFSSPMFTPESRGINNPGAKKERQSTLMQQTASSALRSSPRRQLRRVSTQVMHANAFDELHEEVQRVQSYRKFRRESLQVNDVANLQDIEDGELFEEMKHCRYIRWTKADEAIIEESRDNEPLMNQLALLTLKYSPQVKSTKNKSGKT
ncbi:uncharacterized protein LOC110980467 [Acanthaster planci]|uniref:Uncharacterized protein LOC110980467 n=1 Tax=Acanthaster planci TaxID=133434 RepID=A0A8B7YJQ3_ACAPL|nr:uncharacterized protein LOC110980467 [Acanthaster planci]XP_022092857.1 uncharacterized protein LOC110980467 [Acanthaster planci]